MKLVTLIALFIAVPAFGKDNIQSEARILFAYPDAIITISGPSGSMQIPIVENGQRLTKPEITPLVFRSGWEKREDGKNKGGMFYHFIGKSEYGDIYVITYFSPDGAKEHIPVIFSGSRVEIARADFKAEIKNEN